MELFFSPLACSLSVRIALYEGGADVTFTEVPKGKRLADGRDYLRVQPLGQVPALATDEGAVITECAAVLQYVAARFPEAELAPTDTLGRIQLATWLSFIGTELHASTFRPLFNPDAPEGARSYALANADARLALLDRHLTDRATLLDAFSVADAYLVTILHWTLATPIALSKWPAVARYFGQLCERPSIARGLGEERALYAAAKKRDARA